MWIYSLQLITLLACLGVDWSYGLEKDIEVECLDAKATTITEGGVIANCAQQGLTRTSTINPWLFQLSNVLQAVNASHNHIKRVAVFPVLPRVLTLTLRYNSIWQIEPLAFTGLENLQNLDLSYNRISGDSLKGVLVGKKESEKYEPLPIRILFLSHNNITTLEPSVFEHLLYLRDLHLDYNPIKTINESFSEALHKLPELKLLNLAGTELSTLPKEAFSSLSITSLLLNGNNFFYVPDLSVLGNSLRLLNINQNPIEELNENSFTGLHTLTEITVSGMPNLTKIEAGTFSSLENIRVISCSHNPQLVSIDENTFWNHKTSKRSTLQEVYLNNNGLPRIRKYLLPWLKLTKVTLEGNKWVCDCRLHWLANYLRNRNTTVDRITEIKCWEPVWLNGTQMVFWEIDKKNRHENFPCLKELEEEQLQLEKDKELIQKRLEEEYKRREQERLLKIKEIATVVGSTPQSEPEEASIKVYHMVIIATIIGLVIIIVSIIAFNKYRNYHPIYNVEKMSTPMHNEMKYMKGSVAERTQLVP